MAQATPTNCKSFGGPTYTCTFGSNVTAGNILVFQLGYNAAFSSIAGCGGTWTNSQIDGVSAWAYATGISSGACTVTLTAGAGFGELYGIEVAGTSGVDVTGANTCLDGSGNPTATCGSSVAAGTTLSAPAVTTTQANDLVIGVYNDISGNGPTFTQGTGFTSQGQSADLFIETKAVASAGAVTPTATSSVAASYTAGTIALKASAAASGTFEDDSWRVGSLPVSDTVVSVWGMIFGLMLSSRRYHDHMAIHSIYALNFPGVLGRAIPATKAKSRSLKVMAIREGPSEEILRQKEAYSPSLRNIA